MEQEKKKSVVEKKNTDIVFSKSIKAGKRIYYLDVKRSKNDDLFVAITESKKKIVGFDDNVQVSYEKHKIFLYKEDFDKFIDGLGEIVAFVKQNNENGKTAVDPSSESLDFEEINIEDSKDEEPKEKTGKGFFCKFKL